MTGILFGGIFAAALVCAYFWGKKRGQNDMLTGAVKIQRKQLDIAVQPDISPDDVIDLMRRNGL